ncbi:hypothetical protein NECAME_07980 [Necator americanus]|uniref:Uncharacterized protein n=1 Tax=Necator americanus TaxID=51031 RepID=W2TKU1_NECAM|nr:hypothetical protein NECAME_07980 [Necator americanus]ETN82403.1 hypothetical protein NECAME_07980 [Necator americanus]
MYTYGGGVAQIFPKMLLLRTVLVVVMLLVVLPTATAVRHSKEVSEKKKKNLKKKPTSRWSTANVIVEISTTKYIWICPDLDLYEIVEYAIQHYSSVDDITNAIQQLIGGYRDLLWTVNALVYTRTTADLMPTKRTTSKNLCFVSVTQENIIVYVAAMAADL